MKAAASSAPPSRSPPGCALSAKISSGTTSRTTVEFQSARSSLLENTIFGMSRQMRASATIGLVREGSASAVGQKPAISSWVTRPVGKAPSC
jgi:hypothetical protein